MAMHNVTADLFELQFQKWNDLKYQNKTIGKTESRLKICKQPIITISSEPGIDIRTIAPMLAQGFGLDLFDHDIVDRIAKNAHLSTKMVGTLDEKTRSALDDWLAEEIFDDQFTSKNYLQNLRSVVFTIATHRNAVIVGRGAAFLIQPEDRLALRLVAPLEERVKYVMREQSLSELESREYIKRIAQQRHSFVKKYFRADIEDPVNYNMVINTAFYKPKAVFEIVKTVLNRNKPA